MATRIVRATETGYTMRRGRAATPNTVLPSQMESKRPAAAPTIPPARPEQSGFREKEAQYPARGAADSLHQADIIFAFHGDVGHGRHDAQPGESQHQRGCGGEQSADAGINFSFGIGELAQAMHVGGGNILRERRDVVANLARSARHT